MRSFIQIFALTFVFGMLVVLGVRMAKESSGGAAARLTKNGEATMQADSCGDFSKPLALPLFAKAKVGAKDGWEYSGEIEANFVSARAKLDAWTQNQGWVPENKITLDASLSPKEILTFKRGSDELTMLIWKISGGETGFAYRRESQNLNGAEYE